MVSNMGTTDGCGCAVMQEAGSSGELVAAGGVGMSDCTDAGMPAGECNMAVICCPVQSYVAGFCPAEALQLGTLFPELVSVYQRGC